ncbi:MAG: hypothetical protein FJZ09_00505 [Candidatus Omnitrophica bacterium]|nr:hypothetical protein [Candidatus Omnitrophota bacterium]
MKNKWLFGLPVLTLILCLSLAYCQELTEKEKQVFYEVVEWEMESAADMSDEEAEDAARGIAAKHGISYEQLQDVMTRGYNMPLTAQEEKVADEIKKRLSACGEYPETDILVKVCSEAAAKYRMPTGQAVSTYFRKYPNVPD